MLWRAVGNAGDICAADEGLFGWRREGEGCCKDLMAEANNELGKGAKIFTDYGYSILSLRKLKLKELLYYVSILDDSEELGCSYRVCP